jgi:hypothetical protein
MSNQKKGAITVLVLGIIFSLFAINSKEWRLRFSHSKASKYESTTKYGNAVFEQSERYSPKGMESFYGCIKGCNAELKKKSDREFKSWAKMYKENKDRDEDEAKPFISKVKKVKLWSKIVIYSTYLFILLILFVILSFFIKKIKIPRLIPLLICIVSGALLLYFSSLVNHYLNQFALEFYGVATHNPEKLKTKPSYAFFLMMAGSVFFIIGGIINFLDKGTIWEIAGMDPNDGALREPQGPEDDDKEKEEALREPQGPNAEKDEDIEKDEEKDEEGDEDKAV